MNILDKKIFVGLYIFAYFATNSEIMCNAYYCTYSLLVQYKWIKIEQVLSFIIDSDYFSKEEKPREN